VSHLPVLIQDLGLILMAAAVVTILFKVLKQPVVLGYLIAGFIVGPHFYLLPTVKDPASISIWAEIGVIFMLFGLGLEFSFKKLKQVGKSATITAGFEIPCMLVSGYLVGQVLGWSTMDSLFLGGIIAISSTTIIARAVEELKLKGRSFVNLVFGVLIVEDLIAVLLLVLLSSVAVTQTLSGSDLMYSALRLGFFLVIWFLLGIYLLPMLLSKLKDYLSDETMLIVSIGLCLMMVIIASKVGFSPALGAFVMGSILAETPKGHRIETLLHPVKNLFSAIFFVSVGMLINPEILKTHFWVIILIASVNIGVKVVATSIGSLLSGKNLKNSVQTGMSLAQIGEFSFIIATLGMTLKVTSDFIYPIVVAVSALTTFTTPYMIKYSEKFYYWFNKRLSPGVKESLVRYENAMSGDTELNILNLIWDEYGIKIILNCIIVIAMALGMSIFVLPRFQASFPEWTYVNLAVCLLTILLASPFLWAVFVGNNVPKHNLDQDLMQKLNRLQIGIVIVRFIVGCILTDFVVSRFMSLLTVPGVSTILITSFGITFFSRYSGVIYKKIESRFIANITQRDVEHAEKHQVQELAPWNANLAEFTVTPFSPLVSKTLVQSGIKEDFGVTLAMIERGDQRILAPTRDQYLLPGDKLFLIGEDEQLINIQELIERKPTEDKTPLLDSFGLTSLTLLPTDHFVNQSIRECGLRESVNGLIVGLERDGKRYLSPDSGMILLPKDLIWIVGDLNLIKLLRYHEPV
jgi:CPA2 family monovalent cation:H+ antiporter-2